MLRSIVAIAVSIIVMGVLTMVLFSGLWYGLGPDRLLESGAWKGNMLFAVSLAAITVITRLLGGWMCARIAGAGRGRTPVLVLAGIVLALGAAMAFVTIQKPYSTEPRPPGATVDQFFDNSREPTWLAIFNAVGGAGAVLIGGLVISRGGGNARKPA